MLPATQLTTMSGPTANEALAEPAMLAASWVGSGPPWALVFLVGLALALMCTPTANPSGRRSAQR